MYRAESRAQRVSGSDDPGVRRNDDCPARLGYDHAVRRNDDCAA
jgi:hypothetical protein